MNEALTIFYGCMAGLIGVSVGYIWKHLQDSKYLRAKESRIAKLQGTTDYLRKQNERLLAENKRLHQAMNKRQADATTMYDQVYDAIIGTSNIDFGGKNI